jgi:hypothetical protein
MNDSIIVPFVRPTAKEAAYHARGTSPPLTGGKEKKTSQEGTKEMPREPQQKIPIVSHDLNTAENNITSNMY